MHPRVSHKVFSKGFLVIATLLVLLLASPGYGETPEELKNVDVVTEDLKELVELLENQNRREAFVKDLKNLIQLREAALREAGEIQRPPGEEEVLAIEKVFTSFESVFKRLLEAGVSTASLVARAPGTLGRAKAFLSESESRSKLLRLLGYIAGGIVIGLLVGLLLRRYSPARDKRKRGLPSAVAEGFTRLVLSVAPYAAILASLFVLFQVYPSFPRGQTLAFLIFLVVFLYRLALAVFRLFLAPEDGTMRILPLSDENANYFWVWAARFTNYTAFYFLVTGVLLVAGVIGPSFFFIRGLLLFVFPAMISVFIMQIARELQMRYKTPRQNPESSGAGLKRVLNLVLRLWPIPAVAYTWIIFLFLIVDYEEAYGYLFRATLWTAITVVALFLALRVLDLAFERLFAVNERIKTRFPGLEQKTNQYIRITRRIFGMVMVVFALGLIVQFWGIPVSTFVASRIGSLIILRAIAILITVGVVIAVIQISRFVSDRLLEERKGKKLTKKRKTLIPLISSVIKIGCEHQAHFGRCGHCWLGGWLRSSDSRQGRHQWPLHPLTGSHLGG
jgi:small conductance mechanosensitive channel